ncbi:MAG: alpha/beta hydrolase-fold protein [Lachnospiraceae bacterium]|nr:alpha/beta hydrolase-fold protein [Lachnospiraceae bacterium]
MKHKAFFLLIAAVLMLSGCSGKSGDSSGTITQNTPAPGETESSDTLTGIPVDTNDITPVEKQTPELTATPKPTATPRPTSTPVPTVSPVPTATPVLTEPLLTFDRERTYPDNTTQKLTQNYLYDNPAPLGSVSNFIYETRNHRNNNGKVYQKSALVYLPACYDETDTETRYNVLYLMHGGGDSPKWFLGGEGLKSKFTRMLDSMIDAGEIEPMIVCAVSYYTEYSNDATQNCIDFHYELMNDLIPVFETTYHTYAEDVTPEELAASRTHRAFGGFSMGAVTTWSVFENCLDEFAYFMPMSGDCWALGMTAGNSKAMQTAEHLASKVAQAGKNAEDFFIYCGCGTSDSANPNLTPQINAMKTLTDTFLYCENFANGNLYQCVVPGGHDINTVNQVLYNGVPKLFH